MACFWSHQNETKIEILSIEEIGNVTYYKISVYVGEYTWIVSRRYSEFYDLNSQLVVDHGVSKDILPSKKVIRNKCPIFIENRRKGLQEYLQKTFIFLKRTMPKIFIEFLHFNLYDIYFLLQDLSSKLFLEADFILSSNKLYQFNTLELHAISQFLKKPLLDNAETRLDISPVLDLCSQLKTINVIGGFSSYLQSNIIFSKLPFELSSFKELKNLSMNQVSFDVIFSLGNIRNTIENLQVNNTYITSVSQVLQCDVIHKYNLEGSEKWTVLEYLDLSSNNISDIDITIRLAPKLKNLSLVNNKISSVTNLSHLPNLSHLSLANNLVTVCTDLHTKIGNILSLNLSQNGLRTCSGFSKLYSLETLDLSCNKITEIEEIAYISDLPYLENLLLTGNNVATTIDYRVKVLEYFGDKAKNICLDNERPSQSELDKVSVLRALRIVREGKTPDFKV